MADSTTIVLVHGAWHGAWCWDRVVERLASEGRSVVAVELPGHGDDPGPFTDLHGDAARVRQVLDAGTGPVLLVGHSYGGAVITEAGLHPRVEHLVYLAAFNLDEGETAVAAATSEASAASLDHSGRPDLVAALRFGEDGTSTFAPEMAADVFFNDCTPQDAAWATQRLCRQPMLNLDQTPAQVAWRARPSTYVVCELDNAVHPGLQQILAKRATQMREWPVSHSPFLSRPDLVADLLVERSSS